jgi:chromosome segregation ATPase
MKRYFFSLLIVLLAVPSVISAETPQMMAQSNPRGKIVKKTVPSDAPIQSKISAIESEMATIQAKLEGLNVQIDDLKRTLDRTDEMSEATSLRLQQVMDRRSKFMATLSNINAKINATADSLTKSMK